MTSQSQRDRISRRIERIRLVERTLDVRTDFNTRYYKGKMKEKILSLKFRLNGIEYEDMNEENKYNNFDFKMKGLIGGDDVLLELKSNERERGTYPTYWLEEVKYNKFLKTDDEYLIVVFELSEKYYFCVLGREIDYERGLRRGLDGKMRMKIFIPSEDLVELRFESFKDDVNLIIQEKI